MLSGISGKRYLKFNEFWLTFEPVLLIDLRDNIGEIKYLGYGLLSSKYNRNKILWNLEKLVNLYLITRNIKNI